MLVGQLSTWKWRDCAASVKKCECMCLAALLCMERGKRALSSSEGDNMQTVDSLILSIYHSVKFWF